MNQADLKKILADHKKWLNGDGGGLRAGLSCANLSCADLRGADLSCADLSCADLRGADLSCADLRCADLRCADLRGANLSCANLSGADLSCADLRCADLRCADLSCATGLQTAKDYLSQFERTLSGLYVYKAIGNTPFEPPNYWKIEPMAFLEEVVNPDRCTECGCGVNFATLEWVKKNHPKSDIWKCLILWEDMADVVVPFNTDGKARCARLQLIEVVK